MRASTETEAASVSGEGAFAEQMFGLHMLFDHEETNAQFEDPIDAMKAQIDVAAELGTQVIRFPGDWNGLQSLGSDTTNDWYVNQVMEVLSHAESHGVKVIMMFAQTPEWAASTSEGTLDATDALWLPPENPQDYGDAMAELFSLVVDEGHHDTVVGWEVWNEPNTTWFWSEAELRDGTNVLVDTSEVESYVSILNAAYDALNAVAQDKGVDVTIAGGSLAGNDVDYLRAMYELGAKFDKLALHPYTKADENDPNGYQYGPGEYNSDDPLAAIWSFEHGINAIRELMIEFGDEDTGIWLTEFGWSSDDEWGAAGSADAQAQFIEEALDIISTLDFIEIATLHRLYDASTDGWGLYDVEGNIKPSGEVYAEFLASLTEAAGEDSGLIIPELGDANLVYDDPDTNQHIEGTEGNDWFVIDGLSSDYGWGLTEDGQDHVVWNGPTFNVLYDFETLVFNDRIVTLESPPQDGAQIGEVGNILIGNNRDNELVGGSGTDNIHGAAGADILDGAEGADILEGGSGNDTYHIDNLGDVVRELTDQGTDLVMSTVDSSLSENVENLTLLGSDSIDGQGNNLMNTIIGNDGSNGLAGGNGNDILIGGGGNDSLDGQNGADLMRGGTGSDGYNVDQIGDTIIEEYNGGEFDLVRTAITLTLPENVEIGILKGGAFNAIDITGNDGANDDIKNLILGNDSDNTITTFGGRDVILGRDGLDIIHAGGGGDNIAGGAGADIITGGLGDDSFNFTDIADAGDLITDFDISENDVLDLRALFDSLDGGADLDIASAQADGYLELVDNGDSISVLIDGNGGGDDYELLALLNNVTDDVRVVDDFILI